MKTYQFNEKGSEIQELLNQVKNKTLYSNATTENAGLMSAEDKSTLNTLYDNVGENIQQINELNNTVSQNSTAIEANAGNIATNTSDISTLNTTTGGLATRLSAAEDTLANIFQLDANNFMGIYANTQALEEIQMTGAGWALVGEDLTELLAYVWNIPAETWEPYGETTYDYSDYSGLVSQVATVSSKIGDLTELETEVKTDLVSAINEVKNNTSTTAEDTTYIDNYGMGVDNVQDAIDNAVIVGQDTEVDISEVDEVRAYITVGNKWNTSSTTSVFWGKFIKVDRYTKYRITAQENASTAYAFLTVPSAGANNANVTTFATGCTRGTVPAGESVVAQNTNGKCLWIFTTNETAGTDVAPEKIEKCAETIGDYLSKVEPEPVPSSIYPVEAGGVYEHLAIFKDVSEKIIGWVQAGDSTKYYFTPSTEDRFNGTFHFQDSGSGSSSRGYMDFSGLTNGMLYRMRCKLASTSFTMSSLGAMSQYNKSGWTALTDINGVNPFNGRTDIDFIFEKTSAWKHLTITPNSDFGTYPVDVTISDFRLEEVHYVKDLVQDAFDRDSSLVAGLVFSSKDVTSFVRPWVQSGDQTKYYFTPSDDGGLNGTFHYENAGSGTSSRGYIDLTSLTNGAYYRLRLKNVSTSRCISSFGALSSSTQNDWVSITDINGINPFNRREDIDFIFQKTSAFNGFAITPNGGYTYPVEITISGFQLDEVYLADKMAEKVAEHPALEEELKIVRNCTIGSTETTSPVLSLLHFSDLHDDSKAARLIRQFYDKYSAYIDDMLSTGDIVYYTYNQGFAAYTTAGLTDALFALGNHEGYNGTNWDYKGAQWDYETYFEPYIEGWNVTQPEGAAENYLMYYYKDYTSASVRLIVLDVMHQTAEQLQWFTDTLADAMTNEYAVVVASHFIPDGFLETNRMKRPDGEVVTFHNYGVESRARTAIGTDFRLNLAYAEAVSDFISDGGEFVIWLCGHHHADFLTYCESYPDVLFYAINQAGYRRGGGACERQIGDACANLISVQKDRGLLHIYRIGYHRDRWLRPINVLCYDYINKKVITNY